ncbi:MAG: oligosaccharide flippase family protein [Streptosporangiaceae bacterium]|nr:oligosaccharide flippase family protein [Streptosporangiaceae bacterium]
MLCFPGGTTPRDPPASGGTHPPGPPLGGIGRAALLIGAITMLARAIGFGRQLVFAHTVRASCLGTAYTTANMVPNIIYDIVLGGALTAVVVPVLAGDSDSERSRQTSSALLTWTVLLLAPVSVVVAAIANPLVSVLLGDAPGCPRASMVTVGGRMLMVFAPQILLYGVAVVLYGILQSHRRFAAPALAPVVSSLVVIGTYLWFGGVSGTKLTTTAWPILAIGTTAGVAALVMTPLVPSGKLRLRLRPALRFPDGVAGRVRSLAAAGIATLIAQDASTGVVIVLANSRGGGGALVLYSYAWAVFFLPYAVLAVPIATSAFPDLSARAAVADTAGFDSTTAASARAVIVASWLGAAVLAGVCLPLARVFESHDAADARQLAIAFALFAPGLVGYGLIAGLSRVLYAYGRNRPAAFAVCVGWLLVIVADLLIVPFVPRSWVVPALGAGTTIGLTVAGVMLLVLVGRARGGAALRGCLRAAVAGLIAALAGGAVGWGVSVGIHASAFGPSVGVTILASAAVLAVFAGVAVLLGAAGVVDGGDLRTLLRRVVRA